MKQSFIVQLKVTVDSPKGIGKRTVRDSVAARARNSMEGMIIPGANGKDGTVEAVSAKADVNLE